MITATARVSSRRCRASSSSSRPPISGNATNCGNRREDRLQRARIARDRRQPRPLPVGTAPVNERPSRVGSAGDRGARAGSVRGELGEEHCHGVLQNLDDMFRRDLGVRIVGDAFDREPVLVCVTAQPVEEVLAEHRDDRSEGEGIHRELGDRARCGIRPRVRVARRVEGERMGEGAGRRISLREWVTEFPLLAQRGDE